MAMRLKNVNPNYISIASLILALIAACLYFLEWSLSLLLAAIFVGLSGFLDAIDGKVARISSKASKRGDFLDHVIDRYADAIVLGAIAVSWRCQPAIGLFAVIGVMLASYMGTQAQALGLAREYRGILGRADRIAVLVVISLIQYFLEVTGSDYATEIYIVEMTLIAWMMVYFGLAGNITALQRAYTIWKSTT